MTGCVAAGQSWAGLTPAGLLPDARAGVGKRPSMNLPASGPLTFTLPMWETSKIPAWFLTAMCSSIVLVYQMGIS